MRHGVKWLLFLGFIIGSIFIAVNHLAAYDLWMASRTKLDDETLRSIERTKLSDESIFLARATQASFAGATEFNAACRESNDSGQGGYTTLGCYIAPYGRVYVYRIDDKRVEGIDDAVLVHEILHVAWARLGKGEQDRLSKILTDTYNQISSPKLADRMKKYDKTEPGQRANELHSILPTEIKDLPAELEEYYSRYFDDRQIVVGLFSKYSKPFDDIETKLSNIKTKIEKTEKFIKTENRELEQLVDDFQSDSVALSNRRNSINRYNHNTVSQYNTQIDLLNTRASDLNRRIAKLKKAYQEYTQDIKSYNQAGVTLNSLNASIDSTTLSSVRELK
ncbi:hypothetical protein KC952_02240 [Candidatus Saccharibacteria bacterium]|nr:hypothetical protein [Candidatus Saccharibacteria bacterium]